MKLNIYYLRKISFAMLLVAQAFCIAGLTVLFVLTLRRAGHTSPELHPYVLKLAWLTGAVLILALMGVAMQVARHLATSITDPPEGPTPTTYESAWDEAGKRLDAKKAPPIDPYETRPPKA